MKLDSKHFPLIAASETALWEWLTPQIDDEILRDLCGWLHYSEEENFAALKALRSEFLLERALCEPPNEILELERWGTESGLQPGYDKRKFHLARAWCCTALLRANAHEHERKLGDNLGDELFPLVESLLALGDAAPGHGLTFVRWLAEQWAGETYMVHSHLMLGSVVLNAGMMRHALSSLLHVEAVEHASGEHTRCSSDDSPRCYLSDLSHFDQNLPRFVTMARLMLDGGGATREGLVAQLHEFSRRLGPATARDTESPD